MENERNNILEQFEFGFHNLEGKYIEKTDCDEYPEWNRDTLQLIKELYPVIGKLNLDLENNRREFITIEEYPTSQDNIFSSTMDSHWQREFGINAPEQTHIKTSGNARPMEVLSTISDYNDIVIGLRELLYSEIELCNYQVFIENLTREDSRAAEMILEWAQQFTNSVGTSFSSNDFRSIRYYIAMIKLTDFNCSDQLQHLLEFLHRKERELLRSASSYSSLKTIIESLCAIKNSGLVPGADKLWNLFLIKLYSFSLLDDALDESSEINSDDIGTYYAFIRENHLKIDHRLRRLQEQNSQNLIRLYYMEHISSRAFSHTDVVRQLYDALHSCTDLRDRYLNTAGGGGRGNSSDRKPKPKCFAAMYNRDTKRKYAAISGVFDPDAYIYPGVTTQKQMNTIINRKAYYTKLVNLLKNILGTSYEVIASDYDVKYYYKKNGNVRTVSSGRYIGYPYPIDKTPGNRMFSCCERKLSTKLVPGCEHDFYIKYAPCVMCERMIDAETNHNAHFINIKYMGKLPPMKTHDLATYDKSADAVK